MKKLITTICILLSSIILLNALDVVDGRMKISVNEDNGRFSVFYLEDVNENKYLSLLYKEDPRTSHMSVNFNNRVYILGESFEFTKEISRIEKGLRIKWSSTLLEVTQDLYFISSAGASLADGIHMKVRLKNLSETDAVIGLRFLFDTYLGERSNSHFYLSSGRKITGETSLKTELPEYILSPTDESAKAGLQIMISSPGVTTPNEVILANWKRLNDSSWNYSVNTQRTFSSPPYSINDSAALFLYNPRIIPSGQSDEISLAFGYFTNTAFSPDFSSRDEEISELVATVKNPTPDNTVTNIKKDLLSIRDLVNQIDIIIQSGEEITDEKLYLLEQVIRKLEQRKLQYSED